MKKKNSGITLVALVITIIVLIILAGVSINSVMNGGLIDNAKGAKDEFSKEKDAEQLELAKLEGILAAETLKQVNAGDYTGDENCRYVEGGQTAIIPAGFTVSNVAGENTIAGGLVIYSMDEETTSGVNWTTGTDESGNVIQETYNQYVWIPVENPSDMYGIFDSSVEGIEGKKFGKLYFGEYTTSWTNNTNPDSHYNWPGEENYSVESRREPSVLPSNDTNIRYYKTTLGYKDLNAFKEGMMQEFNNMITSVEKYKGFYIGRYELTGSASAPTIKKGVDPIGKTMWYAFYNACKNLEKNNDNAKDKITTTMIWGCQWDQTVKVTLIAVPDFLTNAKEYGVYRDSRITTLGATGRMTAAYNIYDMGGNAHDWTLEGVSTGNRTNRGGDSTDYSTSYPASSRRARTTIDTGYSYYGCRAQLYIK